MDPLAALRDRVDLIEEQLRQVQAALGAAGAITWIGLKVTRMEWLFLDALASGRLCTGELLLDRLDAAFPDVTHGRNQIRVVIHALRKKLRVLDPPIEIAWHYAQGYQIVEPHLRRLSDRRIV